MKRIAGAAANAFAIRLSWYPRTKQINNKGLGKTRHLVLFSHYILSEAEFEQNSENFVIFKAVSVAINCNRCLTSQMPLEHFIAHKRTVSITRFGHLHCTKSFLPNFAIFVNKPIQPIRTPDGSINLLLLLKDTRETRSITSPVSRFLLTQDFGL